MSSSKFVSRTPASGRPSIAAAQALTHLYQMGHLHLAGNMWHALALMPHNVVRTSTNVFLVMAQGKFAARAWVGSPLKPVVEACHSPSASGVDVPVNHRWGFNIRIDLVWVFTEDIHDWHHIDVKWVANLEQPETYGYVVAEEIRGDEPHIPVLVEALVRRGPHKLRKEDRKQIVQSLAKGDLQGLAPSIGLGGGLVGEIFFMQRLLQGHPRTGEYVKHLMKWHMLERKKAHRKPQDQRREEYDPSATSSSDGENDVMNALTFIALDNMDECNRKEWIKEKKIGNLAGLEGCQRMARDMVRRERGAGRDAYTPGRGNLASGVAKRKVKCGAPWARRYVPGSAESGSALPAETTRAALTCPPNRASWVAQYRNPELQGASKRPTRSKSYRNIPEHRAFQVALDWLWSRHELCCRPVQPRPSWVVDVLAACPHCAVGDPCNFMDTVRSIKLSHGPSGTVESGESSFWEAEGTSDSLSSEAPKVTRPVSKRFKGKQCPPKSLHSPSGHGGVSGATSLKTPIGHGGASGATSLKTPIGHGGASGATSSKRLRVLLVGDSNAAGYCETGAPDPSLRKALSSY